MLLEKTKRILHDIRRDKRAMVNPAGLMKGAGGAGKAAGGAGKAAGGAGGGAGKAGGAGGAGGGMPDVSSLNPLHTGAQDRIDQHKQQIDQLKQALEQKKQELDAVEDQKKPVKDQISQAQSMQQDTTGLQQQLDQLNRQSDSIQQEISTLKKGIYVEQSAIEKLHGDVSKERKLNILSLIPQTRVIGMAGQQAMEMKESHQDDKTASKLGNIQQKVQSQEAQAQQAGASASSAGTQAAAAASAPPPATASAAGGVPSGAGGGAKPPSGNAGLASKIMGGGTGGGSGGDGAPVGSIFAIISAVVGGGLIYRFSSDAGITGMAPAFISIVLFIIGVVIMMKTKGHRGFLAWLIIILIFSGAAYTFGSMTFPQVAAAYQTGVIPTSPTEMAEAGVAESKKGVSAIAQDFYSSYQRSMAQATGQRIDGDVDNTVKEEVGIEILDPYLKNPTRINENEAGYLEMGARIKGFDPKTPITVSAVCHLQSQEDARSSSTVSTTKGPKLQAGTSQRIRPDTPFGGYNFEKGITCYPRPSSCGNYIVTITGYATELRTDAELFNFIIDKEVYEQELTIYAEARDNPLRSDSAINAAVTSIWKEVKAQNSLSQKGAIKVVLATQKMPLIPIDSETSELTLRVGVENMKDGWIRNITKVEVEIPSYFTPDNCEHWDWDSTNRKLTLTARYNEQDFFSTTKTQQKIFPSCHLMPTDTAELSEPKLASFRTLVEYGYLIQKEYKLDIRNNTGGVCRPSTRSRTVASSSTTSNATGSATTGTATA